MLDILQILPQQSWFYPAFIAISSFILINCLISLLYGRNQKRDWNRFNTLQRKELRNKYQKEIEVSAIRKKADKSALAKIVDTLDLKKLMNDESLKENLIKAGINHNQALSLFYFCRLVVPSVLVFILVIVFLFVNDFGLSGSAQFMAYIGMFALGFYAPTLYVKNLASKRQEKVLAAFPDALDMLLVCVEAGISTEQALIKVATEISTSAPDLAEELALTNAELSYLQDRKQAYQNLARRNPNTGVRSVTTALIQAEKYGTPIGSALRVMVKENRELRMTTAERKAASLPTKMTVPMILFFMPVIFIVILGPIAVKFLG